MNCEKTSILLIMYITISKPVVLGKSYVPLLKSLKKGIAMHILLKVVLFQLSGHCNPHEDASPHVIWDSSSSLLGLSYEISFVSKFFLKDG